MLNQLNKYALLISLIAFGGSNNLIAAEIDDLRAFNKDLKILIFKHKLNKNHAKIFAASVIRKLFKELGLNKDDILTIVSEFIGLSEAIYARAKTSIALSEELQGKDEIVKLASDVGLKELEKAIKEKSLLKVVKLYNKAYKNALDPIGGFLLPLRLFLPLLQDLPKQFKKELVQFLLIKQFPELKDIFTFYVNSLEEWEKFPKEIQSLGQRLRESQENKAMIFDEIEQTFKNILLEYDRFEATEQDLMSEKDKQTRIDSMNKSANALLRAWRHTVLSSCYSYNKDLLDLQNAKILEYADRVASKIFDGPETEEILPNNLTINSLVK